MTEAWEAFVGAYPPQATSSDLVLALHGVLIRDLYGVRSVIALEQIRDFQPTHVVTLIDDLYASWRETQRRAQGRRYKGSPTLDQLAEGRRSEILIADLVAQHLPRSRRGNVVLAVRHPTRLLDRLIFTEERRLRMGYLSFPISGPRQRAANGDLSGVSEVNAFVRIAAEYERSHPNLALLCPLTIDELPLVRAFDNSMLDQPVRFELNSRWDLSAPYSDPLDHPLSDGVPVDALEFPRQDVANTVGMIRADVARRDYRLVRQAGSLFVLNPVFDGRLSSGVRNEIRYALDLRIPVHIHQDAEHDPAGLAEPEYLGGAPGALGAYHGSSYVIFHDSVDALLREATRD